MELALITTNCQLTRTSTTSAAGYSPVVSNKAAGFMWIVRAFSYTNAKWILRQSEGDTEVIFFFCFFSNLIFYALTVILSCVFKNLIKKNINAELSERIRGENKVDFLCYQESKQCYE